jgi:hypothetical protein
MPAIYSNAFDSDTKTMSHDDVSGFMADCTLHK